MKHPSETDLALLAGNDAGRVRRFSLERHVRQCAACQEKVDEFRDLRSGVSACGETEFPDRNWNAHWDSLAAEIRANIRLGLEAGECVRETHGFGDRLFGGWSLGLSAAFACLVLLAGASFFMRDAQTGPESSSPVFYSSVPPTEGLPSLQTTTAGVELRSGSKSFTLLNHEGAVANQTVSAQGAVRSRYVDAGAVTINNVYLE
ncbi:MAG TPA: hypothetical protein VG273_04775 [Bryobacteraceae bacterium]|nr:hypothetical protein [Bryobacteraceae bacterium]